MTGVSPTTTRRDIGTRLMTQEIGPERILQFRDIELQARAAVNSVSGVMRLLAISPFQDLRQSTADLIKDADRFIVKTVGDRIYQLGEQAAAAIKNTSPDLASIVADAAVEATGAINRGLTPTEGDTPLLSDFTNPTPSEIGLEGMDISETDKDNIAKSVFAGFKDFEARVFDFLEQCKLCGGDETLSLASKTIEDLDSKVKAAVVGIQEKITRRIEVLCEPPLESISRRDFLQIAFLADFFCDLSAIAGADRPGRTFGLDGTLSDAIASGAMDRVSQWAKRHGLEVQSRERGAKLASREANAEVIGEPTLMVVLPHIECLTSSFRCIDGNALQALFTTDSHILQIDVPLDADESAESPYSGKSLGPLIGPRVLQSSNTLDAWAVLSFEVKSQKPLISIKRGRDLTKIQLEPNGYEGVLFSSDFNSYGVITKDDSGKEQLSLYPVTPNGVLGGRSMLGQISLPQEMAHSTLAVIDDSLVWVGVDKAGSVHYASKQTQWKCRVAGTLPLSEALSTNSRMTFSPDDGAIGLLHAAGSSPNGHLVTVRLRTQEENFSLGDICDNNLCAGLGEELTFLAASSDLRWIAAQSNVDNSIRLLRLNQREPGLWPIEKVVKLADPHEQVRGALFTVDNDLVLLSNNSRVAGVIARMFTL